MMLIGNQILKVNKNHIGIILAWKKLQKTILILAIKKE